MQIVCLDFEGVLVPEIGIEVSRRAGIPELSKTTRDEPDYDKLMRGRIEILDRCNFASRRTAPCTIAPLAAPRKW